MKNFSTLAHALGLALLVILSGCATVSPPVVQRGADPLARDTAAVVDAAAPAEDAPSAAAAVPDSGATLTPGTGRVINQTVAAQPAPSLDAPGEATFNFEGQSLHAVVKAILGDLLQQNYVIAPGVQGQVTLATPRPVNAAQALSLLEMVLGWNNARLVWSDGRYNVLPNEQAIAGNLSPRTGSAANARGYEVRAVPLQFISANEMKKILEPYARPAAIVSVDTSRNLIVLAGTRAELTNYLRTVEIFDVDWLAGMSVGVYPLLSADAEDVVTSLESVFGEDGGTPISGMFRFMPLQGQNAVMVITAQPRYLREVQTWIDRLDAGGGEAPRLYTYEVLYMKAVDLAEQLSSVFGGGSGSGGDGSADDAPPSLMPGLEPVSIRSIDQPAPDAANPQARAENAANEAAERNAANYGDSGNAGNGGDGIAVGSSDDVSISAVEESNALLVRATPQQWESIRRTIERLDTMPLQVHIEAQVIEVDLQGVSALGRALAARPHVFGTPARPGGLLDHCLRHADTKRGSVSAQFLLGTLLSELSEIWPGRLSLDGEPLGDVWRHAAAGGQGESAGLVPFHKLTQWLTYSLLRPLRVAGVSVRALDHLTGLAEYRNGGLFIDTEVLVPKHPAVLKDAHEVGSEVVVEWRALTVALLDHLAPLVRSELSLREDRMPLAALLEGGTWAAGRRLAAEKRREAMPPLRVISDGTVF